MARISIVERKADGSYGVRPGKLDATWVGWLRSKKSQYSLVLKPIFPSVKPLRVDSLTEVVKYPDRNPIDFRRTMIVVESNNQWPLAHGDDSLSKDKRQDAYKLLDRQRIQVAQTRAGKADLDQQIMRTGFLMLVGVISLMVVALVAIFVASYLESQAATQPLTPAQVAQPPAQVTQ